MNESDNKGDNEIEMAESLYKQYQRQRSSMTTKLIDANGENAIEQIIEQAAVPADRVTDKQTAGRVYLRYQESRKDNNELAVDRIMHTINKHAVFVDDAVSQQSVAAARKPESQSKIRPESKPIIESIDATTGQVFNDAVQDKPAANHARRFRRLVLPAIAAAVLAIALIPVIVNQSPRTENLQAQVPELLLENAEKSVAFLDPPVSSGFGFTNTDNPQNVAFRYGVVMTEVALSIKSGAGVDAIPYARQIVSISPPENAVEGSPHPGNAAISLISTLNVGAGDSQLDENLETFRMAIEHDVRATEQMDWYSTGQWVESIRIAARYSLDEDDVAALQQALSLSSEFNFPQDIPAVVSLLDELATLELTPPDEFEQASQIIDVAENIKVLMR